MPTQPENPQVTIRLQDYSNRLASVSRSPHTDVRHLLAYCLGCTAGEIRPTMSVPSQQYDQFVRMFARCEAGEPVAYVLEEWDFWGLTLRLQPGVLIPRADTESLVAAVLAGHDEQSELDVLDCGTGSGAIALALATERPHWRLVGVDKEPVCVACAQENARNNGFSDSRVHFYEGDWLELSQGQERAFDVLVANPPYIAEDDQEVDEQVAQYEPREALFSGQSGYAHIRSLVVLAQVVLRSQGRIYIEHGYRQGETVRELLRDAGFIEMATLRDFAGKERVTTGLWSV